jgi:hypothetical protein
MPTPFHVATLAAGIGLAAHVADHSALEATVIKPAKPVTAWAADRTIR